MHIYQTFVVQTSVGTGHSCSSEIYNEEEVLCNSGKVAVYVVQLCLHFGFDLRIDFTKLYYAL